MANPVPIYPPSPCRAALAAIRHSGGSLERCFSVRILRPDATTGLKRAQVILSDGTIWKTLTYGPDGNGDTVP